ncbi:MAG TPA: hypothetical protein VFS27_05570 [Blastocatellia bacterium]|jgi:hypothetical protein|nr:hypothetical protein [Blastocatellia bacterium]
MNYELFKKRVVSLALTCVVAFSTLVGNAVPANAQGYERQYIYSYPYVSYPSYQPYVYYPQGFYPTSYPYNAYPYGYYPYDYHGHHHHWYEGRHHIKRAFDWLF